MSAAAAGGAAAAVPDFVFELEPLDWIVIAAAAVCVVVLVREWRRGPGLFPVPPVEQPEE